MSRITVRKADRIITETEIGGGLVLGRHPSANVQLEDAMISRQHAKIVAEGGTVTITDLNSVNGVFVNGQKLEANQATAVQDGDVATIHDYEIAFSIEAGEEFVTRAIAPPVIEEDTAKVEIAAAPAAPPPSPNLEHLLDDGIPVWRDNQEVELVVADIIQETHDVRTYRMVGKSPMLFSYKPGQFATLKLDIDGASAQRCYSISSTPSRPHTLEMTIKRVPGGLVSNYMHDNVKLGDVLTVQGPAGNFSCFSYPKPKIGCIAAGSGITPVMSMSRWILDTTADVDVVFLNCVRSPQDIVFRKELELMSARHSGMQVYISVSAGGDGTEAWTGLKGRITSGMLEMVMPDIMERHLFACGPPPFMEALKKCLIKIGFDTKNLYSESFGPARQAPGAQVEKRDVAKPKTAAPPAASGTAPVAPSAPAAPEPARGFNVSFQSSGVDVPTDGEGSLLDLAEANGVNLTCGCRMGSCLMCKVKKVSGEVRMDDNMLPDDLKAEGYILTCVGHPESDVVLEA